MRSKYNATYYGKNYRQGFAKTAEHMSVSNLTGERLFLLVKLDNPVFRKTTKPFL